MEIRAPREFAFIAGHPALDLVNSVQWRLSPERFEDDLPAFAHVLAWTRQARLISDADDRALTELSHSDSAAADDEVGRVRELREALYAALYEGGSPTSVVAEYRAAVAAGELTADGDAWVWRFDVDLTLPRRLMSLQAFDLITGTDLSLLGQCHDAECGWVFLDTSPRHNRRWCVSADCGNRNRVRGFYERSRSRAATD
jgi:predicted RNA-binding Zn ribbon-like protein